MVFKYENNIISVDNGITISTLFNEKKEDYKWTEGFLRISDLGKYKTYNVYISDNHKDYPLILRPRERYECRIFEDVFGFNSHCRDYDENRIISIRNPDE